MRRMLSAAVMVAQLSGSSNGGTGPVSPSVLATTMNVMSAPGVGTLELLVLWRGAPGWFMRGGGQGGGGSSSGGGIAGDPGTRHEWISQGGVTLNLRFETRSRRLWILNREVALNDANVVLVDGVDEPGGPRVAGTVRIDAAFDTATDLPPGMPGGPPGVRRPDAVPAQTFIRRSPELIAFLQCDVGAPNTSAYEQKIFEMWCSWVTQP